MICVYCKLGYSIFTNPNEKFVNVDVRAFIKSDAKEPHFGKSSYGLKKFNASISLIQMLLVLAHQIILSLMLYDVINYNDVTSTICSHEYTR